MAWEELLRSQDTREDGLPLPGEGEAGEKGGLIQRVNSLIGQPGGSESAPPADNGVSAEPVHCADGYLRRSPVQLYCTAEGYGRRRIRKILLITLGVALAILLVVALVRAKLFRLR